RAELLAEAADLPAIPIDAWTLSDLEMIGVGACSPLTGFMNREDYDSVVESMRLASGLGWSIPTTLAGAPRFASRPEAGRRAALVGEADGGIYVVIAVESIYQADKKREAVKVFKPADLAQPGVARLMGRPDVDVGGAVRVLNRKKPERFAEYYFDPADTRRIFAEKGWRTIVGFQTRNPAHRAHEYIQKSAMEIVDGLFLNPLVGETKSD